MKKFKDLKIGSLIYVVSTNGTISTLSISSISNNDKFTITFYNNRSRIHPRTIDSSCEGDYSGLYYTEMSEARKKAIEILRKKRLRLENIIRENLDMMAVISKEIEDLK